MRRPQFDQILSTMLAAHANISDLIFAAGRPFQVEADGELRPVFSQPQIERLTPYQTEQIALTIVGENQRLLRELLVRGSCDCSYALDERTRFRANIFKQRGRFGVVMRRTQATMPTLGSLGLGEIFRDICRTRNGLVLVTGSTSSGKTTTLSALLDEINATQAAHVVTLEDPIEFVHEQKRATFSQRECGNDFDDFPSGLRSALRQAPKVILVGEIRDRATVEIALTAAETGHLVLSSLHTINAGQTINRLLGMFETSEHTQMRLRLMETIRYVVSQRLVPRVGGGRALVQEIMGSNLRTREVISLGEGEGRSFYDIIEANTSFGWTTFDQSLMRACMAGEITEETALLYATHRNKLIRLLDEARKREGRVEVADLGMRLDRKETAATAATTPAAAPGISLAAGMRLSS
jgi:twitching motility protein PilT